MKKEIKKFWEGKVYLGVSFWVWYIIGGGFFLLLPFWIVPDSALDSDAGAIIMILYFIFMLVAVPFLMIGTWRSAEEYKKIKRKKKQGAGWAAAAQFYIVLSVINIALKLVILVANL